MKAGLQAVFATHHWRQHKEDSNKGHKGHHAGISTHLSSLDAIGSLFFQMLIKVEYATDNKKKLSEA